MKCTERTRRIDLSRDREREGKKESLPEIVHRKAQ